jgi:transcriptional regulator with XRE-family HTH domain
MNKSLNQQAIQDSLTLKGLSRKDLAESIGVSAQAVTNWLKGKDYPRPAKLLKLATTLQLSFEALVNIDESKEPIIAFRKRAGTKTTDIHIAKAKSVGVKLKPLIPYLSEQLALRTLITSPSTDYLKLQSAVSQTRLRIGLGADAVLRYEHLIGEFKECGSVLVPVLWGNKTAHENALHIRLPEEDVTFIFLNLDTQIEDFKFWMAHELAHVFTPNLAGTDEGENYADAFAGALLFPLSCAEEAYSKACKTSVSSRAIAALYLYAEKHSISLYTVYKQVKSYASAHGLPALSITEKSIHSFRASNAGHLVSEALYSPAPPTPARYISSCSQIFESDFFDALKRMVQDRETGYPYIQQIMGLSILDAKAL